MSLADDITPKPAGPRPTVFDVLSARKDWQTVELATDDERRWYAVGYQMAPDRAIDEMVSEVVPSAMRLSYAIGLADGIAEQAPRVPLSPSEKPAAPADDSWRWQLAILGGAVGAVIGVALVVGGPKRNE